jgi:hypothetical protein
MVVDRITQINNDDDRYRFANETLEDPNLSSRK